MRRADIAPNSQIDAGSMRIKLENNNLTTDLQCTVATLGNPDAINQCDAVQVVYRDAAERLSVFSTHVVDANPVREDRVSSIIYNDPDFRINPGSSGGGVYKDGALIANNWSSIFSDFHDQNDNWLRQERKGLVRAALLPDSIRP